MTNKMQSSLEPLEHEPDAGNARGSRRRRGDSGFGSRFSSGMGGGRITSDLNSGGRMSSALVSTDIGELGMTGEVMLGTDMPVCTPSMDIHDVRPTKRDAFGRDIKGTGLLIERDVLQREDDFGGNEVKPKSLVASSNLTIMHAPIVDALAIPAAPGSQEWKEMRSDYLVQKEDILRAQHQEAMAALAGLKRALEEHRDKPLARGPAALFAFVQQLQRMYTSMNRVISPLQSHRVPSRFLDDLVPPPENEDHSFDPEHIKPWVAKAQRVLDKTVTAIVERTKLLQEVVDEILANAKQENQDSAAPQSGKLEQKWSTYFVRRADPKACSAMLDAIALCEDALFGRNHFDFSKQRLSLGRSPLVQSAVESDERNMGTLSYSRMLIPDTWSLVRKAPLFRSSVDGSELMHEIASRLRPQLFQANTLVIKQGTIGMSMYFINSGCCKVAVSGKEIAQRQGGDFFGELALTIVQERMADVYCDGTTELFELSRGNFNEIIKRFPHVYERIRAVGTARVKTSKWEDRLTESEKLKLLDDEHLQDSTDLNEVKEAVSGVTLDMPAAQEVATTDGAESWEETVTDVVPADNQSALQIIRNLLDADNNGAASNPEMLNAIVSRLRRVSSAPGVTILRKGDQGENMYIIESGTCKSTISVDEKEVSQSEAGSLIGVEALVLSGTHHCDWVAGPDGVRLLKLARPDLMALLQAFPVFYEYLRDVAAVQSAKRAQMNAA